MPTALTYRLGLIPPLMGPFSQLDESLAAAFGRLPRCFPRWLGAPRRGIAMLEIGKLEGTLKRPLRNPEQPRCQPSTRLPCGWFEAIGSGGWLTARPRFQATAQAQQA